MQPTGPINPIDEYFLNPIAHHSGYNLVNMVVYALIALIAVYAIYKLLQKLRVSMDLKFFMAVLPFVLFGSTVRAITDSVNYGIMDRQLSGALAPLYSAVKASHVYDYGFLTVSPGIYIVTAALFLASFAVAYRVRRLELLPYAGLAQIKNRSFFASGASCGVG